MGEQAREIVALLALLAGLGGAAFTAVWMLARRGVHVEHETFMRGTDRAGD